MWTSTGLRPFQADAPPTQRLYTLPPRQQQQLTPEAAFPSNWAYRQYMTHHARDVMKHDAMAAIHATGNNPYCNTNTGRAEPQTSDLKFSYWQTRDRKERMFSPIVPHDAVFAPP
jgi:hypothetical protein